jgi:hypothetical protein
MARFTIGNPKYLGGLGSPVGHGGFKPLTPGLMVDYQKHCSPLWVYLHANSQILFIPLGICGFDLTPSTIWISADTNITSITLIIDWGIGIKYNGTNLIGSILKF